LTAALGAVFEVTDAIGVFDLNHALFGELVDRVFGHFDAPLGRDTAQDLNADLPHQWTLVLPYPHHLAPEFLRSEVEADGLADLEIVLDPTEGCAALADVPRLGFGVERLIHAIHAE